MLPPPVEPPPASEPPEVPLPALEPPPALSPPVEPPPAPEPPEVPLPALEPPPALSPPALEPPLVLPPASEPPEVPLPALEPLPELLPSWAKAGASVRSRLPPRQTSVMGDVIWVTLATATISHFGSHLPCMLRSIVPCLPRTVSSLRQAWAAPSIITEWPIAPSRVRGPTGGPTAQFRPELFSRLLIFALDCLTRRSAPEGTSR